MRVSKPLGLTLAARCEEVYGPDRDIEWAFAGPWSVKAEYLYVDLGNETYHGLSSSVGFTSVTLDHRLRENIARAGINYRFGGF